MGRVFDLATRGRSSVYPVLLDENFRTYFLQEKGNAKVYVEKWAVRKNVYFTYKGALGHPRKEGVDQYLIKEDSFTDIGGGYATFLKHYAQVPESWFEYELKSALIYYGNSGIGINYDHHWGKYGYSRTHYAKRNNNYLAKATRYYFTAGELQTYINNGYRSPDGSNLWTNGTWLRPDMKDDNNYRTNSRNVEVPSKLLVNAPIGRTTKNDPAPYAIATDRIRLWQPSIYEVTRYTSAIGLNIQNSTDTIPLTVIYTYDSDVSEAKKRATSVYLVNKYPNAIENAQYFHKDLTSEGDKNRFHGVAFDVSYLGSPPIGVKSVSLTGATIEEPFSGFETEGTIRVKWDGLPNSPSVVVRFNIGLKELETI